MKEITELNQSKYCYVGTNVLINKNGITNDEELKELENVITTYKLSKLYLGEQPFKKSYDLYHYLNIHKYLFEDIYPFAGDLRVENISKSNEPYKSGKMPFCQVPHLLNNLRYTLDEMKHNLKNLKTRDDVITFFSKYYLDLNVIHPFREGNGRTQREFFREYIELINEITKFNFKLDYNLDLETKEQLHRATVLDDLEKTKKVFDKIIKENEIVNINKK